MTTDVPQRRKLDHAAASPFVQIGTAAASLIGVLITGAFVPMYLSGQNRQEERQRITDQRMQRIEEKLDRSEVSGAGFIIRMDRSETAIAAQAAQINQLQQDVTSLKVKVDVLSVRRP